MPYEKVKAIKELRNITGCGLAEADDIVKMLLDGTFEENKNNNSPSYKLKPSNVENELKCPKCGSTQIQMVPRKWSLLTGFLTNKVDRVCMNCKHKF